MELLRNRTREGYGVAEAHGELQALKPLSESYIKVRSRIQLSSATTPSTSNLTQTGDMLDSLFYRVSDNRLQISVKGAKNLLKAIYTSVDRPWANLSASEAEEIRLLLANMTT